MNNLKELIVKPKKKLNSISIDITFTKKLEKPIFSSSDLHTFLLLTTRNPRTDEHTQIYLIKQYFAALA